MIYETNRLIIYFGDAHDAITKAIDCIPTTQSLIQLPRFSSVAQSLNLTALSFAHQVHGIAGIHVQDKAIHFDQEADFLWTEQKNRGIGVMTADCLPIVVYNKHHHVAAIAHAGWPGTIANIAAEVVKALQEYGSRSADLQLFFGPSAKPCCYEVSEDFLSRIPSIYLDDVIERRDYKLFFDLPKLNRLQLQEFDVAVNEIAYSYNFCTICNYQFFSHRRQGAQAGRQMTIVCLK